MFLNAVHIQRLCKNACPVDILLQRRFTSGIAASQVEAILSG